MSRIIIIAFVLAGAAAAASGSVPAATKMRTRLFESGLSSNGFFPEAPENLGGEQVLLRTLLEQPAAQHSDALIVLKDGRVLTERYFGSPSRPVHLASVTKAVVSLAIMTLLAEGRIASLDAPMSTWFPGWTVGPKRGVTLRHVLTHRSGLNCERGIARGDQKLFQERDTVDFAAAQPLSDEPGKRYCYNNAAIQLLAEVIDRSAGEPADDYLDRRIFKPLGATKTRWLFDRSGKPLLYGGLSLTARDLAKIGQLMLQEGRWEERQLIPAEIVRRFTSPSENADLGLIWHLTGEPDGAGPGSSGYYHDGAGGQYLVIYPRWGIVGVRLHDIARNDEHEGFNRFFSALRAIGRSASTEVPGKSKALR